MNDALAAYIGRLPHGLDSYPETVTKAANLRQKLDRLPALLDQPMPPALRRLVDHPPPSSAWFPTCQLVALNLVICEMLGDDEAFREFTRQQSRALLSSPLYRALFFFLSAERLARAAPERFRRFHRGTRLEVSLVDEVVHAQLSYPEHLMTELQVLTFADVFAIALELAGWGALEVKLQDMSPTLARYELR